MPSGGDTAETAQLSSCAGKAVKSHPRMQKAGPSLVEEASMHLQCKEDALGMRSATWLTRMDVAIKVAADIWMPPRFFFFFFEILRKHL